MQQLVRSKNLNIESRRYIGSKLKLKDWILELVSKECEGDVFADIFGGTGIVAAEASKSFKHVILNDLLYSNFVIYQAFFGPGEYSEEKILEVVDDYNQIDPFKLEENYFSTSFANTYYSHETSKLIGHLREDIEAKKNNFTEKEYYILLASLLYSIDRIANTVGHYDAYIRKELVQDKFVFRQIQPLEVRDIDIYRADANELARKIAADVVYIDPPYNSRQYSRFYHVLETLIKWDKARLNGVALKPMPENMSKYCTVSAKDSFEDLIQSLNCKYIVVSYNNTYNSKSSSSQNKIKLEDIEKILNKKGKTSIHKKSHQYFNTGKTDFNNHQEWLFITKVK